MISMMHWKVKIAYLKDKLNSLDKQEKLAILYYDVLNSDVLNKSVNKQKMEKVPQMSIKPINQQSIETTKIELKNVVKI